METKKSGADFWIDKCGIGARCQETSNVGGYVTHIFRQISATR
jgi:hypothetical protein